MHWLSRINYVTVLHFKLEVLMTPSIKLMDFWNGIPYSFIDIYHYFKGICFLNLQDRKVNHVGKNYTNQREGLLYVDVK
jgi:hypothetical protein